MRSKENLNKLAAACYTASQAMIWLGFNQLELDWSELPDWKRYTIMHTIAFWDELELDNLTVEKVWAASHLAWCNLMRREHWVFGLIEDEHSQPPTHPDLVPYDQLPEIRRKSDEAMLFAYTALRHLFT
jgi:hypothetical protein